MKLSLINMPFAPLGGPPIGLLQLATAVNKQFGRKVDVQTCYLNLDVAAKMRPYCFYRQAVSPYGRLSGLSEWFFRSAAFPAVQDNIDAYLARYYFDNTPDAAAVVDFVRDRRGEMIDFLDELIDRYDLASADMVGFSLSFFQTVASIALANRLKARNPDSVIVFGGPAVKGVPGRTLVDVTPAVDYVCSGPGLVSFPELVACSLSGEQAAIPKIRGVFARGVPSGLPPDQWVGENVDMSTDLPLDYTPFLDKYDACVDDPELFPYLLMQTSRGCWWADMQRCTFCGLNDLAERFEALPPAQAIRHIRSVLQHADRVSYFVACDNVTPPNYFQEVFPHLETPPGVFIKYETRPTLTPEEMQTLCKAGIRCVQPGIEALSTESLKLMRKGVTAFTNIRFLKECLRHHLFAEWNILLFSPGEQEEVYRKYERDIPKLVHLQPPADVFPIEFVRDSCYFLQPETFGLELEPHESLFYIYPFDRDMVSGLCLRFSDRKADTERITFWLERLGGMVAAWRQQWSVAPENRPRLVFWRDAESAILYDSRSGAAESYRISDTAEAILNILAVTPMTVSETALACALDERVASAEIASLNGRGLLFEEDHRYLSLAVSNH